MLRISRIVPLLALAACTRPEPPRQAEAPPGGSARTDSLATSIARAREIGPGARAALGGTVNVASGAVDAGFALQDGPRAIYVAADSGTRLGAGQMVRVNGRLTDQHGLLVVIADSVRVTGRTAPFPAVHIRTRRIGEVTEALLVGVQGRITAPVVDDRPYGWKITIDDGGGPLQVFVPAHHAFDPAAYGVGEMIGVEGMSAQYDSTYEVIATGPLRINP
jgi:hypothetical protein